MHNWEWDDHIYGEGISAWFKAKWSKNERDGRTRDVPLGRRDNWWEGGYQEEEKERETKERRIYPGEEHWKREAAFASWEEF